MIRVNENYAKLKSSYLFSDIARRVAAYVKDNPDREIIRVALRQRRVVLTRDLGLLKNKAVAHGAWLRSAAPEQQLKVEREELARLFTTKDMQEGMTSFFQKRKPDFKGE